MALLEWERLARGITTTESSTSANPSSASTSLIPPLPLPPGSTVPTPSRPAFVPPNARRGLPPQSQSTSNGKKRGIFANLALHRVPRSFPPIQVTATDPVSQISAGDTDRADLGDQYTSPAYTERTSRPCHPLSFNSLSAGELPPDTQPDKEGVVWDVILCSFALHLVPPQELFPLCYELATKARWLAVIAPHKKPEVSPTAYSGCLLFRYTTVHTSYFDLPHSFAPLSFFLSATQAITKAVCHLQSHHPFRPNSGHGHGHRLVSRIRARVHADASSRVQLKETWGWTRWDIASWKPAGDKLYRGGGRGDREDDDEETELEIVRDK